jgi:hypothetical protein
MGDRGRVGHQPGSRGPPEGDRSQDAQDGHERRRRPHPRQRAEIRLQADPEKEDEHTDLGQEPEG